MRSWVRILAAFVGALALVLPILAQAGHFAIVAHVRCAEHGDLVHAEHAQGGHAGHHDARADVGPDEPAASAEPVDEHGEHEHCGALGCQAPAVALSSACADVRTLPPDSVPSALSVGATDARARLLGLAPKTSPPPLGA